MVSRKWIYSYRILTARLHEKVAVAAGRTGDFVPRSVTPLSHQVSVNDELTEGEPAKPKLLLTGGSKG